jgi:hypothetical protein
MFREIAVSYHLVITNSGRMQKRQGVRNEKYRMFGKGGTKRQSLYVSTFLKRCWIRERVVLYPNQRVIFQQKCESVASFSDWVSKQVGNILLLIFEKSNFHSMNSRFIQWNIQFYSKTTLHFTTCSLNRCLLHKSNIINLSSRHSRFQEHQKLFALHGISQKSRLEKNEVGQPFASMPNSFLHLLGFEARHSPALFNKKICLP